MNSHRRTHACDQDLLKEETVSRSLDFLSCSLSCYDPTPAFPRCYVDMCFLETMFVWVHRHGWHILLSHAAREWPCAQKAHAHPLGTGLNLSLQQLEPFPCFMPLFSSALPAHGSIQTSSPDLPFACGAVAMRSHHDERRWCGSKTWQLLVNPGSLGV